MGMGLAASVFPPLSISFSHTHARAAVSSDAHHTTCQPPPAQKKNSGKRHSPEYLYIVHTYAHERC